MPATNTPCHIPSGCIRCAEPCTNTSAFVGHLTNKRTNTAAIPPLASTPHSAHPTNGRHGTCNKPTYPSLQKGGAGVGKGNYVSLVHRMAVPTFRNIIRNVYNAILNPKNIIRNVYNVLLNPKNIIRNVYNAVLNSENFIRSVYIQHIYVTAPIVCINKRALLHRVSPLSTHCLFIHQNIEL